MREIVLAKSAGFCYGVRRAVELGVNKINISSDIKVAYHDRMREVLGTDRGRSAAAEAYGIHDVPSHVLIGPDGRILGRGLTPQAIEALLKEPR